MIPFALRPEPATFHAKCRMKGQAWLAENPSYVRPRDFWSQFEPDLREAFGGLCGYCAMMIFKGQVDHFEPVAILKTEGRHAEAYEWRNFRYGEGVLNARKSKYRVLDPFHVESGWFQILLPSLEMVPTDRIPSEHRELANVTLHRLGLRDGEVVVRYRQEWFDMYRRGELQLSGLRKVAPLLAIAVEKDLNEGLDWRSTPVP